MGTFTSETCKFQSLCVLTAGSCNFREFPCSFARQLGTIPHHVEKYMHTRHFYTKHAISTGPHVNSQHCHEQIHTPGKTCEVESSMMFNPRKIHFDILPNLLILLTTSNSRWISIESPCGSAASSVCSGKTGSHISSVGAMVRASEPQYNDRRFGSRWVQILFHFNMSAISICVWFL